MEVFPTQRDLGKKVCGSVSGGHDVMFPEYSGPLVKGPFIPELLAHLVLVSAPTAVTMAATKADL